MLATASGIPPTRLINGHSLASDVIIVAADLSLSTVATSGAYSSLSGQPDLTVYAPLASPYLTGTPLTPTATQGTNSQQVASTAFVKASIDALVAGAPGALDTLNEIASQLSTDESAVSALTTVVSGKVASTRQVNGHALSSDVTISYSDLSGTIPTASTSTLGGVKVDGTSITISGGVISGANTYTLPTASTSTLGGVKVDGTSITISGGVISATAYSLPTATASVLGGVKPDGTTLTNTSGAVSVTYGTVAGTAAQGNDTRIVNAPTLAQMLSYLSL